jgi:hypothetical protein
MDCCGRARNVPRNPLDIGVETSYFLDKEPGPDPQIALVDLNPHGLEAVGFPQERLGLKNGRFASVLF